MSGPCTSTYTGAATKNIYRCGDFAGHEEMHTTSDGGMCWDGGQANKPEPEGVAVYLTEEQIFVIGGALSMLGADPDERMVALKGKLYTALVSIKS